MGAAESPLATRVVVVVDAGEKAVFTAGIRWQRRPTQVTTVKDCALKLRQSEVHTGQVRINQEGGPQIRASQNSMTKIHTLQKSRRWWSRRGAWRCGSRPRRREVGSRQIC